MDSACIYYTLSSDGVELLQTVLKSVPDSSALAGLYVAADRGKLSSADLEALSPLLTAASISLAGKQRVPATLSGFLRAAGARPAIGQLTAAAAGDQRSHGRIAGSIIAPGAGKTLGQMTEEERELWREERRARAAHREYGSMVADVRRREITQVSFAELHNVVSYTL